ncbi:uncharacterized protein [Physcomitrium patens]|uniref:uncharacterized protein n=1 Tax=Physcomitrium patens TaxID=3218 RepID=UPI003CCD6A8D
MKSIPKFSSPQGHYACATRGVIGMLETKILTSSKLEKWKRARESSPFFNSKIWYQDSRGPKMQYAVFGFGLAGCRSQIQAQNGLPFNSAFDSGLNRNFEDLYWLPSTLET